MIDNGYDISDYYSINSQFGTMETSTYWLVTEAHQRGIRIVMDIVVNHTSTEHAWFQSALGDKKRPYRVTTSGKTQWTVKHQPTGSLSLVVMLGKWIPLATCSTYSREEQADLNWENPVVREEVKKTSLASGLRRALMVFAWT